MTQLAYSHRSDADFDTVNIFVTFSAPVAVDATLGQGLPSILFAAQL
jgi:hypothetical protein